MKKAVLTIAIVLFAFTAMFAANTLGGPLKSNKSLSNKVSLTVPYPDFALTDKIECSVWAVIKAEANGNVTVVKCDSQVASMRNYVRERLETMNLEEQSFEAGKEYTIRIDFTYLK